MFSETDKDTLMPTVKTSTHSVKSVRMRENTGQKISECGHFSCSDNDSTVYSHFFKNKLRVIHFDSTNTEKRWNVLCVEC